MEVIKDLMRSVQIGEEAGAKLAKQIRAGKSLRCPPDRLADLTYLLTGQLPEPEPKMLRELRALNDRLQSAKVDNLVFFSKPVPGGRVSVLGRVENQSGLNVVIGEQDAYTLLPIRNVWHLQTPASVMANRSELPLWIGVRSDYAEDVLTQQLTQSPGLIWIGDEIAQHVNGNPELTAAFRDLYSLVG